MKEHPHISLFRSPECHCTDEEAEALAVVAGYRAARVAERRPFMAENFKRHWAGFTHYFGDELGMLRDLGVIKEPW